jgi:F-type H+/Na+-transporting ATPase subunit alpha
MALNESFLKAMQDKVASFEQSPEEQDTGVVLESADGIAHISGVSSAMMGEMLEFPDGILGRVFNLEREEILCAILDNHTRVKEGAWVKRTGNVMGVAVGPGLLGRIINPIGAPLDGKGAILTEKVVPLERPAPGIMDRQPVKVPLQTGYKVVDSLVPIGRGQRELIIGDRQTGKTTLALDTIINQKDSGVLTVFVAIGQKESTVVKQMHKLKDLDLMKNVVVVVASASAPAILQYLAPYVGCAIAEYFMYDQGRDTLVVYDDLTKHASAYRHISLLMRRPPGREAYPGDIFYLHSRLLERAGRLAPALGGGSMTALPIIETQGNDISAYIPTNVISITDGQIFLEAELFNAGIRPAVNAGISVSRVGGNAQIKAMRQVSGTLRIDLAQYREKEAFSMFASELDEETSLQLRKGATMVELLKQDRHEPMPVEEQVVILYAGTRDFLAGIPLEKVKEFEARLLGAMRTDYSQLLARIAAEKALSAELEESLRNVIGVVKEEYLRGAAR